MSDNRGSLNATPPAPLPDFVKAKSPLPFTPPKPPVLRPDISTLKKNNPQKKAGANKNLEKKESVKFDDSVKKSETTTTNASYDVETKMEELEQNEEKPDKDIAEKPVKQSEEEKKSEISEKLAKETKEQEQNLPATKKEEEKISNENQSKESTPTDDRINMRGGLMDWLSKAVTESKILSDVATKARYGVEQVIITLDPGMKGFLSRDGVVDLYMSVEDHLQIKAVQDGFEKVFANVLIRNVPTARGELPATVFGSVYALEVCRTRIQRIIQSKLIPADAAVLVFQPFVFELEKRLYHANRLMLKWKEHEYDSISQLLDVEQTLFDALQKRSKADGKGDKDFSVSISAVSQQVYGLLEENWAGPPPPYSSAELLAAAASVVALKFMNLNVKLTKG